MIESKGCERVNKGKAEVAETPKSAAWKKTLSRIMFISRVHSVDKMTSKLVNRKGESRDYECQSVKKLYHCRYYKNK